ncbi:MAG: DnaD domain protein [Syntrophomonadaceae bacterium]|nr:DnaD domain protein [Syntrophomonadaceae bacterium]
MQARSLLMEMYRWSFACLPGAVFNYAKELDLDIEDIGIFTALFYTLEQSRPLYDTGITPGQVLQTCPLLTTQKLSRRLNRLKQLGVIDIDQNERSFTERTIHLEPLMEKLEAMIKRDHPRLNLSEDSQNSTPNHEPVDHLLDEYRERIVQLELSLEEEKGKRLVDHNSYASTNYKKVADFISKKTGNLMSVKMSNELHKWLEEMGFTTEFLLCMLELCFERNIFNPRDITKIARDLKEYAISTVEGLEMYFKRYVDNEKSTALRINQFDPDVIEFGNFTGIDMSASARKQVYYKWRYDWGFSHAMIMKAGEIMCQRTRNGGLEYIDSVLNNWMSKEIRRVEDAEKELQDFKQRNKTERNQAGGNQKNTNRSITSEYEIYVPPGSLEELKTKV